MKTNNFKESEIEGYTYINGRRVTVLKPNIKRLQRLSDETEDNVSTINEYLLNKEKWKEFHLQVLGDEEWENI